MSLLFNSSLYYCRYVISKGRDNVLDLGLCLPAGGQHHWVCKYGHVSSSQLGTRSWKWGEKEGGCLPPPCYPHYMGTPGLSHNVHGYHYLVIFMLNMPWQFIMSTHLAGLCSLLLQAIILCCICSEGVFKFSLLSMWYLIWSFTHLC